MKKLILPAVIVAALAAQTTPALAQFGALKARLPGLGAGGGGPTGGGADIDGFIATTEKAEALTRVSAIALLESVASHDEAIRMREVLKAAEAKPDPKEREAALRQLTTDLAAQLAAVDYEAKSKELEKSITATQRKQLASSVYNLAIAILMDKTAVEQGHALSSSAAANPMAMAMQGGKLLKVRDAAQAVGGQMGNLGKISMGLPKLMSVAHITALPTSSTDTPRAAAD